MTKPEFQDLQKRAAVSGMTLKLFFQDEGVAYSTYKAHFGRGSEGILMEVLSQNMSRHVLP